MENGDAQHEAKLSAVLSVVLGDLLTHLCAPVSGSPKCCQKACTLYVASWSHWDWPSTSPWAAEELEKAVVGEGLAMSLTESLLNLSLLVDYQGVTAEPASRWEDPQRP